MWIPSPVPEPYVGQILLQRADGSFLDEAEMFAHWQEMAWLNNPQALEESYFKEN